MNTAAILVSALFATSTRGLAATYYVDQKSKRAADSNPGTMARPFLAIAAGAKILKAGDTLIINPGVYRETVSVKTSGAKGRPIVIRAAKKGTVTVRGSAVVSGWRRSGANKPVFLHDGWDHYFGECDESLVKRGDQFKAKFGGPGEMSLALNQIFVNDHLIREVACLDKLEEGTFYIAKDTKQIHLWLEKGGDPNESVVEVTERDVLFSATKVDYIQVKGLSFGHCANRVQKGAVNFRDGNNNLIEDCETSYNNCIPWKRVNVHFQAGGFKVALTHKVKFLRRKSIGNYGPGFWFDISNDESEVANCFAADNAFAGVMNEISYRIHVHDCVIVNNKGAGVLIAESPGALLERNIVIANGASVSFRDMRRSTAAVAIVNGKSVKGKKAAIWNHDEVVRKNLFVSNKDAQVKFGVSESSGKRQVPARLQNMSAPGKKVAQDQETRDTELYQDESDVPQPSGLSLEKLNFSINENVYWSDTNVGLHVWKDLIVYNDLKKLFAGEHFEENGAVSDPKFANWKEYDFRLPEDSPLIKMGCYPRGEVPGAKLGVIRK